MAPAPEPEPHQQPPPPAPAPQPKPPAAAGANPQRRPPMQKPRRPPPRPRKHRKHGNVTRARWGVVVIFCLLCVVEAFFLNALTIGVPGIATPAIFGSALWITALLIALWRRNAWARLLLIVIFALAVIGSIIMAPNTLDPKDRDLLMAYVAGGLAAMGCGAYLAASRDIYRLTSRDRE